MAVKKLNLTWDQFQELRAQCDTINHAYNLQILEGEVKDTIVVSEWSPNGVELKLDI